MDSLVLLEKVQIIETIHHYQWDAPPHFVHIAE